jgi:hypothetical protein
MEVLDLLHSDAKCGADSPSMRILTKWVQMGAGELKVIALKGIQTDVVDMWIQTFQDKGVKLKEKREEGNTVIYLLELPEGIT